MFIIPSHHSAEVVETGEPRWRWAEVETRRLGGGGKGGGEKGEQGSVRCQSTNDYHHLFHQECKISCVSDNYSSP